MFTALIKASGMVAVASSILVVGLGVLMATTKPSDASFSSWFAAKKTGNKGFIALKAVEAATSAAVHAGVFKILDFGVLKIVTSSRVGVDTGSPMYCVGLMNTWFAPQSFILNQ
jgi:hypothetical protein